MNDVLTEIVRVGDVKKVQHIELMPAEQLVAVISGRNRQVCLVPMMALEGREVDKNKVADTKNCQALVSGVVRNSTCFCLVIKRQISCFEINKSKSRHCHLVDIQVRHFKLLEFFIAATDILNNLQNLLNFNITFFLSNYNICKYDLCPRTQHHQQALSLFQAPGAVQWMGLLSQRLCVGYPSGFMRYSLYGESPPVSLLHPDDPTLAFIRTDSLDAICAVEISNKEMLLCFSKIAVYVDTQGRRSRQQELMWPAMPTACCESRSAL